MARKILLIILTVFLILLVFVGLYYFFNRSKNVVDLSLENSYLFASPLVAKAGQEELITVSAFALSSRGLGMTNQKIILHSTPQLKTKAIRDVTDPSGLAIFELTSLYSGQFTLWAEVEGRGEIRQRVRVEFE